MKAFIAVVVFLALGKSIEHVITFMFIHSLSLPMHLNLSFQGAGQTWMNRPSPTQVIMALMSSFERPFRIGPGLFLTCPKGLVTEK